MAVMLFFMAGCGGSNESLATLGNHSWPTAQGGEVQLQAVMGSKGTVFITLDPECPLCQLHAHELQVLAARHHPEGVNFVGVYTGPYMDRAQVVAFATGVGFSFPQLMDGDCALAHALKARVTPECFLADSSGKVVYQGAFDDRAVRQGRKRIATGAAYLADAITNYLRTGEPQPGTTAVGCLLECGE